MTKVTGRRRESYGRYVHFFSRSLVTLAANFVIIALRIKVIHKIAIIRLHLLEPLIRSTVKCHLQR